MRGRNLLHHTAPGQPGGDRLTGHLRACLPLVTQSVPTCHATIKKQDVQTGIQSACQGLCRCQGPRAKSWGRIPNQRTTENCTDAAKPVWDSLTKQGLHVRGRHARPHRRRALSTPERPLPAACSPLPASLLFLGGPCCTALGRGPSRLHSWDLPL